MNLSQGDLYYQIIKGSSSDRRKIISDTNLDLYKRIKNFRNGEYMGMCKECFYFTLVPLKDN